MLLHLLVVPSGVTLYILLENGDLFVESCDVAFDNLCKLLQSKNVIITLISAGLSSKRLLFFATNDYAAACNNYMRQASLICD